jgi:hydrogenase maturation factor
MSGILPLGKLPVDLLEQLLKKSTSHDERLLMGPGIGLDCAVLDYGERLLVFKSDPITFATDQIGWYAVQVNANDIVTTGAEPRWLLAIMLLPEGKTTGELADGILSQVFEACQAINVTVIGGHTEITHGIDRPILAVTLVGEVARDKLVTPRGAQPGDRILLSKGVPIEATAILAREFPDRLASYLTPDELRQAAEFLYKPGISIFQDARLAVSAGRVNAMHDPTEGGLLSALWELAQASGRTLYVDLDAVHIPKISNKVCRALGIDVLAAIASGALLLSAPPEEADKIQKAWEAQGIAGSEIGWVDEGPVAVYQVSQNRRNLVVRPERDEIARFFDL